MKMGQDFDIYLYPISAHIERPKAIDGRGVPEFAVIARTTGIPLKSRPDHAHLHVAHFWQNRSKIPLPLQELGNFPPAMGLLEWLRLAYFARSAAKPAVPTL